MSRNKNHPRAVPQDELRQLAEEATRLARQVRAAHERLRRAADEPTRRVGYRLDDVAGHLDQAAGEIIATINDLTRVQNRGTCAADWGLCPNTATPWQAPAAVPGAVTSDAAAGGTTTAAGFHAPNQPRTGYATPRAASCCSVPATPTTPASAQIGLYC